MSQGKKRMREVLKKIIRLFNFFKFSSSFIFKYKIIDKNPRKKIPVYFVPKARPAKIPDKIKFL